MTHGDGDSNHPSTTTGEDEESGPSRRVGDVGRNEMRTGTGGSRRRVERVLGAGGRMLTDYVQDQRRQAVGRKYLAIAVMLLLLAGIAGALTGNGDSARPASAAEVALLGAAGERAQSISTARLELRVEFEFNDQRVVTLMDGALDNERRAAAFDLTFPDAPAMAMVPPGIRMIGAGDTVFIAIPEERRDRTGGKAWASTAVPGEGALAVTGASPATYLESLQQQAAPGKGVERMGTEDVRGVATTHYRVELDLQRIVAGSADQAQLEQLKQLGAGRMPMDVYLDEQGLPRKTAVELDGDGFDFGLTFELFDIGQPVDIPAPPPLEETLPVGNLQELLQQLG